MWMKVRVLAELGIRFPNLPLWAMAGLGITMALKALHSSRKAREVDENEHEIDESDNGKGINRLPDDILCNIVSRLKFIEASRTSILSRRWRKVWILKDRLMFFCLSTLDVSKKYHDRVTKKDKQRFFKAVNQCLHLYSGLGLKIFLMHCCFLNDYLAQWMQTLARLDVEQLYLGHNCERRNGDPLDSVFTFSFKLIDGFRGLKYFNLVRCNLDTSFIGQCKSLKSLDLMLIRLLGNELSDILLFCPNLTSLSMERCELSRNLRISGPDLKLKNLIMLFCSNVQTLEISLSKVMTIKIDIRNEVEILLSSVPKLERLHLRIPSMNYRFGDFPRAVPQLKYLLVQTPYQILRLPPTFHVFSNVRILFLVTRGNPYPEASVEVDLWNFAPVLSACPLLDEFYLEVGGPLCKEERNAQWPVLRHEHLSFMELSGFSNTQNELEFAKFILTSAQVLRSLRLRLSTRRFDGKRFYFEDVKDSKHIDSEAVCADLQVHAISMVATVVLF